MPDCDYSMLPVDRCAHCRQPTHGHPDPPRRPRPFVARYDGGPCAGGCGWDIEAGEQVRYDDDGHVVHARCG